MRPPVVAVLALLSAMVLAGCVEDPAEGADPADLVIYPFVFPGTEVAVPGADHGWLFQVRNPTNGTAAFHVGAYGVEAARLGPAGADAWSTTPSAPPAGAGAGIARDDVVWGGGVTIPAHGSVAYLASIERYAGGPAGLLFVRGDGATRDVPVQVTPGIAGTAVRPGDHVQTVTVGVWTNGTSFYTNSRSLLDDPGFPAGGNIVPEEARQETDPLPVYVYDRDRTEQPAGSQDTCHFTTITGYNALLRSQAEGSTGVRWMKPEDAYTRAGAEEHLLYGDALVFLNVVVAHEGSTGPADALPVVTGACFDAQRPVPPVPQ